MAVSSGHGQHFYRKQYASEGIIHYQKRAGHAAELFPQVVGKGGRERAF